MPPVVIFAEQNEHQILPTIQLADALRRADCQVIFTGVSQSHAVVSRHGHEFFPIYESVELPVKTSAQDREEGHSAILSLFFSESSELHSLVEYAKPSLVLLPPYLALEGHILNNELGTRVAFLLPRQPLMPRRTTVEQACRETVETGQYSAKMSDYLLRGREGTMSIAALIAKILEIPEFVIDDGGTCGNEPGERSQRIPLNLKDDPESLLRTINSSPPPSTP